jgi:hypothetical protein
MPRAACRVALLLAVVAAGGCGRAPARADVTGRVTYNGAPLDRPGGTIVFVGPDNEQVPAAIHPDGTYRAAGVLAGPNRVAVWYAHPAVPMADKPTKGAKPPGPPKPTTPFLTPTAYASVDTSKLTVDVAAGTVFDPALTGPPLK